MNGNKLALAGALSAVLSLGALTPSFADTAQTTQVPTVEIKANSFRQVRDLTFGSRDRIELSAQVEAADLNLANPQDEARLQRRVASAARRVCTQIGEKYPSLVDADDQTDEASCVRGAIQDGMAQVRMAETSDRHRGAG